VLAESQGLETLQIDGGTRRDPSFTSDDVQLRLNVVDPIEIGEQNATATPIISRYHTVTLWIEKLEAAHWFQGTEYGYVDCHTCQLRECERVESRVIYRCHYGAPSRFEAYVCFTCNQSPHATTKLPQLLRV